MKIERISENQIRCILSQRDLQARHLKISELAYGSEKAKKFFRELMEQANMDLGFEVGDIPIVIEAIPANKDSIVLLVTKVEDQEEFDKKFAHLHQVVDDYNSEEEDEEELEASYDEDYEVEVEDGEAENYDECTLSAEAILDCMEHLHGIINSDKEEKGEEFVPLQDLLKETPSKKKKHGNKAQTNRDSSYLFSFKSLSHSIKAAQAVSNAYDGKNSMWKDDDNGIYFILLSIEQNTKTIPLVDVANKIVEFGTHESNTYASDEYLNEHFTLIIKDHALQQLAEL